MLIVNKKTVDCIDRCERKVSRLFCATFLSRGVQKVFFFLQLLCGYTALFIGVFFLIEDVCIVLVVGHIFDAEKKIIKNPDA